MFSKAVPLLMKNHQLCGTCASLYAQLIKNRSYTNTGCSTTSLNALKHSLFKPNCSTVNYVGRCRVSERGGVGVEREREIRTPAIHFPRMPSFIHSFLVLMSGRNTMCAHRALTTASVLQTRSLCLGVDAGFRNEEWNFHRNFSHSTHRL